MSLTSELKVAGSPIGIFMRTEFPHLKGVVKTLNAALKDTPSLPLGYDEGYPLMLVGTAIDLRIRHYVSDKPTENSVIDRGFHQLSRIEFAEFDEAFSIVHHGPNCRKFDGMEEALRGCWAEFAHRSGLLDDVAEDRLCRLSMLLATVEQYGRSPISSRPVAYLWPRRKRGLDRLLVDVDPRIAGDLAALSRAFHETAGDIVSSTNMIAGGSPVGAPHVGGADFDFVADGTLFEVKTTTNPGRVAIEALRQLIGYLLLDWDDQFQIRRLGLILPRQRTKMVYDVAELLGGNDLAEMRDRMRTLVTQPEPTA
jgi:hypothetical protein